MVIDNSGSIHIDHYDKMKVLSRALSLSTLIHVPQQFISGFTKSFTYGPLQTALALIRFSDRSTTSLTIEEGLSGTNVDSVVESLRCKYPEGTSSEPWRCFDGSTSISSGIRRAADEMAKETRSFRGLTKVLSLPSLPPSHLTDNDRPH